MALDTPALPDRRQLGLQLAGAFIAAGAITVLVVLPAEYRIDPTGFGRLTGLTNLSPPQEVVIETRLSAPPEITRPHEVPFRTDTIPIHIGGLEDNYGQMEYKITMKPGDTMVYSWTASHPVYYEFHGHTLETADNPEIEVMNYEANETAAASGSFTAPLEGIHGWYFLNRDVMNPLDIELKLSGYYELTPGVLKGR